MPRTGRRVGESGTKEAILSAARNAFSESGYDAATMRSIAASAGVDPALLHHYFGTKEQLFIASMRFPLDPGAVVGTLAAGPPDEIGDRLVRLALSIWDNPESARPILAIVRSAVTNDKAAAMLREFISSVMFQRLVSTLDVDHARLRANLVASQIFGLLVARYIIKIEPLATADHDTIAAAVGPTLQRYLVGDLELVHEPRGDARTHRAG